MRWVLSAAVLCAAASCPAVLCVDLAATRAAAAAGWSAANCGREPLAPAVDSGSVERYNASIDKVGAYDRAARAYSECVSRQAVAEQGAISNDARARMAVINNAAGAVQRRIAGNFAALSAQLRAGGQKLGARR